jgi:chromosome segregation ATPase
MGDVLQEFTRPIDRQLQNIGSTLQKWTVAMRKETVEDGDSNEFEQLNNKLRSACQDVMGSIDDLEQHAILDVEQNRSDFRNVTDADLRRAKEYVQQTRRKVQMVQQKVKRGQREIDNRRRNDLTGGAGRVRVDRSQMNSQQIFDERKDLIAQQDHALDQIEERMGALQEKADNIYETVEKQNEVLEGLGEDLNQAKDRFDAMNMKLKKFLGTNDSCQTTQAIVLFVMLMAQIPMWMFLG